MGEVDVALFLPSLHGGGSERVMVRLAQGFTNEGLRVDLVLANAEGPYLKELPQAVRVINLKSRRVLYSLPGLVRYLRRERPKAMLSTMAHTNIIALWGKKIAHVPTRLVIREATNITLTSKNSRLKKERLLPLLIKFMYSQADSIVANSQGVAKELIKITSIPSNKITVIYNPVISPDLFAKADEPLSHPWFNDNLVILSAGRLSPEKDFSTLIEAFAIIYKEHQLRLMILGEGRERAKLEALVQQLGLGDYVALPGFVDNPYKYMKRASVFVLSSRWEGLPNVLIEALALGTPVVATDCPSGPREILEEGRWGRLVPPGDVNALADAVRATLQKKPILPPPEWKKAYEVDTVVRQYLNLLGVKDVS